MIEEVNARFVAVRVELNTQDHPEKHFRMELFDAKGLPTVGLIDSKGQVVPGKTIGRDLTVGKFDAAQYVEILKGVK